MRIILLLFCFLPQIMLAQVMGRLDILTDLNQRKQPNLSIQAVLSNHFALYLRSDYLQHKGENVVSKNTLEGFKLNPEFRWYPVGSPTKVLLYKRARGKKYYDFQSDKARRKKFDRVFKGCYDFIKKNKLEKVIKGLYIGSGYSFQNYHLDIRLHEEKNYPDYHYKIRSHGVTFSTGYMIRIENLCIGAGWYGLLEVPNAIGPSNWFDDKLGVSAWGIPLRSTGNFRVEVGINF